MPCICAALRTICGWRSPRRRSSRWRATTNPKNQRSDVHTMQKNLLIKTGIIVGVLIAFLYGIFGIPSSLTGEGLKKAVLNNIKLGLDLKGGMHLILEVMVNDAVNAETDHAVELLKDEMQRQRIAFSDVSKPDPNHPEKISISGVSLDASSALRSV